MKRRIIVIGGVAAGPSAASKAKRVDPDSDVVVYEAGDHISYGVCEIPYYVGGEIADPEQLIIYSPERLKEVKGVTARVHHLVESIALSRREVTVRDLDAGTTFTERYDALIIATGSLPKQLPVDGTRSRNVFSVKRLDEAYALQKFIKEERPRSAVIVGAGFIGLEMAEALTRAGLDVTMVHRSAAPMSRFDEESSGRILEEMANHKIRFIPNSNVEWMAVGARQNVVAVGTKRETIETDLVIVAIGVEPNTALAREAGIAIGSFGGIVTDERLGIPNNRGVFAAGDCCEIKSVVTGRPFYQSLATTASRMGWIAGENAVGGRVKYNGAVRAIGCRFFGLEIAHVGLTVQEASESGLHPVVSAVTAPSIISMMPGSGTITITTIADKRSGRLLGAHAVGSSGTILRANVFAAAIKHGMTVHDIAELDLIYNPPISPLWDGIVLSGIRSKKML